MSLQNKVAIVTGSSRGIGKAIALRLADSGADIVLNAINNIERCEETVNELKSKGVKAMAVKADVGNLDDVQKIIDTTISEFGRIDILVNNAGVIEDMSCLAMTDESWEKIVKTNLTGAFNMSRAAAKSMLLNRYGRIINITSFVAQLGNKGQANYAASKGGLESLTKTFAIELSGKGITVNAVAPGAIETEMSKSTLENFEKKLVSRIPAKRIGKPEDIASLVNYLAQEEAGYITGEVIGVSGGLGLWLL